MKKVALVGKPGMFAVVDDADFERVSKKKWELTTNGYVYCRKRQGKGKREFTMLHRFILMLPPHLNADHINRNKLDNRRSNLRPATHAQNMANSIPKRRGNGNYKGAYFKANRWVASISQNSKTVYLGRFKDPKEAAKAYDAEATRYFGEFALTNEKLGLL